MFAFNRSILVLAGLICSTQAMAADVLSDCMKLVVGYDAASRAEKMMAADACRNVQSTKCVKDALPHAYTSMQDRMDAAVSCKAWIDMSNAQVVATSQNEACAEYVAPTEIYSQAAVDQAKLDCQNRVYQTSAFLVVSRVSQSCMLYVSPVVTSSLAERTENTEICRTLF